MDDRNNLFQQVSEAAKFSTLLDLQAIVLPEPSEDRSTDCHNLVAPCLDFTYQEIKTLSELPSRTPSTGLTKEAQAVEVKAGKPKRLVNGIRLSYNNLTSLEGLEAALEAVLENPKENLNMLDLSHNQLSHVEPVLGMFKNLTILYLHGNQITNVNEIKRLNSLTSLQKLTLQGNACFTGAGSSRSVKRLEDARYYRPQVLYALRDTLLKNLDQTPITPKDRENALVWATNFKKGERTKD